MREMNLVVLLDSVSWGELYDMPQCNKGNYEYTECKLEAWWCAAWFGWRSSILFLFTLVAIIFTAMRVPSIPPVVRPFQIAPLNSLPADITSGNCDPHAEPRVSKETVASAWVDGGSGTGFQNYKGPFCHRSLGIQFETKLTFFLNASFTMGNYWKGIHFLGVLIKLRFHKSISIKFSCFHYNKRANIITHIRVKLFSFTPQNPFEIPSLSLSPQASASLSASSLWTWEGLEGKQNIQIRMEEILSEAAIIM